MKPKSLVPRIKLTIETPKQKGGSAFGPGVAALLEGVREKGSLNASAKAMGMAYSKAWRIVKETEDALGLSFLDRDGARGSSLTPDCVKLLDTYWALQNDISKKAEEAYQKLLTK